MTMNSERIVERIPVDAIHVGERHRALDEGKVAALAASIHEIGRLMTPISVFMGEITDEDGEVCETAILIAGAHRLAAVKQLGWAEIDAFVLALDPTDRELWEIDENLARSELTPAQIAEHMARRKVLWEKKSISVQVASKSQAGRPSGFASETARATGRDKSTITRAVARGEKIAPDVLQAVQGTKLDTGASLDKLAKLPAPEQRRAVSQVRLPDEPLNEFEATQKQVATLMAAWNKAGPEAREQFLARIDRPVFDRTRAGVA